MVLLLSHCFTTTRNNRKRIGCYRLMSLVALLSSLPFSLWKNVYVQFSSVWTSGRNVPSISRTIPRVGRKKLSHRASSSWQLFQFELRGQRGDELCHFWKIFSPDQNDSEFIWANFFFFFRSNIINILPLIDDLQQKFSNNSIASYFTVNTILVEKKETIYLTYMEI